MHGVLKSFMLLAYQKICRENWLLRFILFYLSTLYFCITDAVRMLCNLCFGNGQVTSQDQKIDDGVSESCTRTDKTRDGQEVDRGEGGAMTS